MPHPGRIPPESMIDHERMQKLFDSIMEQGYRIAEYRFVQQHSWDGIPSLPELELSIQQMPKERDRDR